MATCGSSGDPRSPRAVDPIVRRSATPPDRGASSKRARAREGHDRNGAWAQVSDGTRRCQVKAPAVRKGGEVTGLEALLFLVASVVVLAGLFLAARFRRSDTSPPEGTPFDPPPHR